MGYRLGVDLGTTYCAAAVYRDGRVDMVTLGNRSAAVPSVAYVREDGEILVGEAAERRAASDPQRAAREFKRRVGDPVPLVLGGKQFAAQELMALQLPPIIRVVSERQGGPPEAMTLTVPANWSEHRRAVFTDALPTEHLPPLNIITEPEAAAIHYASNERIDPGEVVAVYDLGGGTFDAAILRRTAEGFVVLGTPEGIDRLGGIDFDAAVFSHVDRVLDGRLGELDMNDPIVSAGVAQFRQHCVEAKEALSEESDTEIPVMIPGVRTEIRMTRTELEAMIRPALNDSVGALRRALTSAEVTPDEVTVVLLVGGSSRIPLVAQLVGSELGRPVAVDTHPKHAIALGAALAPHPFEAQAAASAAAPAAAPATVDASTAVVAAAVATPATPVVPESSPLATPPVTAAPVAQQPPTPAASPPATVTPPVVAAPVVAAPVVTPPAVTPPGDSDHPTLVPNAGQKFAPAAKKGFSLPVVGGVIAALAAIAIIGFVLLSPGDEESVDTTSEATAAPTTETPATTTPPTTEAPTTAAPTTEAPTTAAPTTEAPTTTPPTTAAPDPCDVAPPFVCLDSVTVNANGDLEVAFTPIGFVPDTSIDHIHFFLDVGAAGDNPLNAGVNGPNPGSWVIWDAPNPATPFTAAFAIESGATEICGLLADSRHNVGAGTGTCLPLASALAD